MTQANTKSSPPVESQSQRWLKYGGNVAIACVAAVMLAVLVTYVAERRPKRIDTTASGLYSLKAQTLKIIENVNTPIRLVSLYTSSKPPESQDEDQDQPANVLPPQEATQIVNDLLQEYSTKGHDISFETIDPVTSPSKVDDLIEQVEAKYGGEIRKYKDFVDSFKDTITAITNLANPEVKAVAAMPLSEDTDRDVLMTMREAFITVEAFPKNLDDLQDALQRPLRQRPPDYKGAADAITDNLGNLATLLDAVINNFKVLETHAGVPPVVALYMKQSLPHYQEMKKLVGDTLARAKGLGELKLDTLRSALRQRNTILVMGDKEWRAINYDQVWRPASRNSGPGLSDEAPRPRFAGEQQVTAAILSLTSGGEKPKVAIVRAGGPPLAQAMPFGGGGDVPLADAADRLGLYNFDVVEKDLTGQFAAESQGMVSEPTDADIKNATWVVWDFQAQQNPEMGEPPSIAQAVADHLRGGGSAVILTTLHQDNLATAISDWGVSVNTNAVIIHEKIPGGGGGDSGDVVQQVLRLPFVFDLHDYGDHPLANPINSLEGLLANMCPVSLHIPPGYHGSYLLPIPTAPAAPKSWATTNLDAVQQNQVPPFDPTADIAGPVYAGAAVQKDAGGGRLVVLACGPFCVNQWLELTAQQVDPNAPQVLRFPGNGELFTNSVFWAAHQDALIDISPAAMDVGRIRDISPPLLRFVRVGILLVGLPGLCLLTGLGVYLKRRD
jgi:ABC-type uncharacterized transport system